MIFRLSHKLNARIKAGTLATVPADENPLADWSAALFAVGRAPYVLVSNTRSLFSTVLSGKGITNPNSFIERTLNGLQEALAAEGHEAVFRRGIAPAGGTV